MGRRGRVPLYEFMRQAGSGPEPEGDGPPMLAPGVGAVRSVRLPVGLLLLVGACAMLIGVGLYALGFHRGSATTEARLKAGLLADLSQDPGGSRARDPVGRPEAGTPKAAPSPGTGDATRGSGGGSAAGGAAPESGGSGGAAPATADPAFVPGLHYLVLMQVPREGAERFARFCADQGLAVKVVKQDNAWLVIWLPGHPSLYDPEFGRVKTEELPRLASAWRAVEPRGADFADAYVRKID